MSSRHWSRNETPRYGCGVGGQSGGESVRVRDGWPSGRVQQSPELARACPSVGARRPPGPAADIDRSVPDPPPGGSRESKSRESALRPDGPPATAAVRMNLRRFAQHGALLQRELDVLFARTGPNAGGGARRFDAASYADATLRITHIKER